MPKQRIESGKNALRGARAEANLTQKQAAERVGVSRTLWSAWEGKTRPISLAHLNKIQKVLELSEQDTNKIRRWWGDACFEGTTKAVA